MSNPASAPVIPAFSRALLPRGLITLILLRYKAVLRRLVFGSAKRRLFTFLGLGLMAVYILPNLFLSRKSFFTEEGVKTWLPVFVVFFIISQIFVKSRRDPMVFQPAEIDLVVPGPFSRRQLVLYQVLYQIGPLIAMGFWMALFIKSGGSYLSAALGITLLFFAINLVAGIINTSLGILQNISRAIVPILFLILGVALYFAVRSAPPFPATITLPNLMEWVVKLRQTPIIEAMCVPVKPYANVLAGSSLVKSLPWAGLAFIIDIVLIAIFIAVDRGEVETMVTHSQKQLAKAQVARRSGISNPEAAAQRQLPSFHSFGGVGPLIWRQLTIMYRSTGPIVLSAILIVVVVSCAVLAQSAPEKATLGIMVLVSVLSCFALSQVVRCDFRSDLDHMALFKTLPIPAGRLVLGQLTAPVLIIAFVQSLACLGLAIGSASITNALWAILIIFAALPFSAMLIAIDNTVFLLAPVRPIQSSMQAGVDPSQIARIMLITLAKFAATFAVIALIGLPTWGIYVLAGPIVAFLIGLVLSAAMIFALVIACAKAFEAFNVADDQPA